jgi:hypothetical protein
MRLQLLLASFSICAIVKILFAGAFVKFQQNSSYIFVSLPLLKMNTDIPGVYGDWTSSAAGLFKRTLQRFPPVARGHVVAIISEFAGTTLFLFFAFAGTQIANISSNPNTGSSMCHQLEVYHCPY